MTPEKIKIPKEILDRLRLILLEFESNGAGKHGLMQAARLFKALPEDALDDMANLALYNRFQEHGLGREFLHSTNDRYF